MFRRALPVLLCLLLAGCEGQATTPPNAAIAGTGPNVTLLNATPLLDHALTLNLSAPYWTCGTLRDPGFLCNPTPHGKSADLRLTTHVTNTGARPTSLSSYAFELHTHEGQTYGLYPGSEDVWPSALDPGANFTATLHATLPNGTHPDSVIYTACCLNATPIAPYAWTTTWT